MDPDPGISDEAYTAMKRELKEQKKSQVRAAEYYAMGLPLTPPSMLTLSKSYVLETRSRQAKRIHDKFALLKAILDRHEARIHKRWLDKKPKQRLEVLRKAWKTDMALSHRPDFTVCGPHGSPFDSTAKVDDAYMWPYINQEDLLKPRNLLWFMATRGRHHPSKFAATDIQAMHSKLLVGAALFRGHLPDHVMMFTGRESAECYGELLDVHEHANEADWLHLGLGSTVAHGLLVLEAQKRTLSFLVACAKLVLHDVNDLLQGPKLAAPTLPEETGDGFSSLAAATTRAPYLPPACLDFDRILSLLAARRDQAANHLLSLREDPGYFRDTALEIQEHQKENVRLDDPSAPRGIDPSNRKHQAFYWSLVLGEMLTTDHMQYEMYAELHAQAQSLRQMSESFAGAIHPECMLPETYMHALLKFRFYLKETFTVVTQSRLPFAGSPPWRNQYHRRIVNHGTGAVKLIAKESRHLTPIQLRLQSFLASFASFKDRSLANEEHNDRTALSMKTIGITKIMDSLQHLVESEAEAKEMLTPYLASSLGNLATITECLRQLEHYQPWASTFEPMMTAERFKTLRSDYDKRSMSVEEKIGKALAAFDRNPGLGQMGRLGAPAEGIFLYPVGKRKNEQTVAALRRAESDLDRFWNGLGAQLAIALSEVEEMHLQQFLTQPRDLQRTPPWVEPTKVVPQTVRLHTSIKELDLNRQLLTERTIFEGKPTGTAKVKTKTRAGTRLAELDGDAQAAEVFEDEIQEAEPVTTGKDHTIFMLNARALKVFKTIFFTPSIDATPGEVVWNDFLYAMKAVGFTPEAMGGSEWHFHPETIDFKHGIVFHSPHPNPKMSYRVARRHGRDLRRAYGWEGHMFTLA